MKANHDQLNIPTAVLCRNNCGFYGNERCENYCSKCYNDIVGAEMKKNTEKTEPKPLETESLLQKESHVVNVVSNEKNVSEPTQDKVPPKKTKRRTCAAEGCRKKLTLTSVECKCGQTFCSSHRYAEQHECPYDYKATKQEILSKANPLVAPEKIAKI